MSICPYLGHAKLLRTYPQLRAGTLEEDFKPPKKVTEMIFPGGCPGDQRIAFRPLAACFGSVLESNQAYNPRTPSFCSLSVVKKKGITHCIQAKPTISQTQLSTCFPCNPLFLFLTPKLIKIDPESRL
jgi:hypothetical protein